MDRLLAELRNVTAPARHVASHHAEARWREAGVQLAEAAAKYETFVFQTADTELLPKLRMTAQRLIAQVRQQQQQQQGDPRHLSEDRTKALGSHVAQQAASLWARAAPQERRSLRLCHLLERSLLRGGAGLEDDGGLSSLYAVRAAPSGAQQRLSRLLAQERDAVAAVAAAVAAGPGPMTLPLDTLRQALQTAIALTIAVNPTATSDVAAAAAASTQPAGVSSTDGASACASGPPLQSRPNDDQGGNATCSTSDDPVLQDPILGRMLAAAEAAGVPTGDVGLPLTPANLRMLLRRHPCAAVRRAAYERGLLPRLEASLLRLGAVAAVRAQVAALLEFGCFAEYSSDRAGLALGDAGAVTALLQVWQLREALRREEAQRVSNTVEGKPWASTGAGSPPATPGDLAPWDVEYARALWMQQRRLPPDPAELRQYMHLEDVLYGISDLLYDLMGVRLEVDMPLATARAAELPTELWDPRVMRLTVYSERGMSGVVYLDPGSGYGTRQLRFPSGASVGPAADGDTTASRAQLQSPSEEGTLGAGGEDDEKSSTPQMSTPSTASSPTSDGKTRRPRGCGDDDGYSAAGEAGSGGTSCMALPAVAVGLQYEWHDGVEGNPSALHELLHELGHALHLALSSKQHSTRRAGDHSRESRGGTQTGLQAGCDGLLAVMHFGGLQQPLDLLEVPSSLMQTLAYDPAALARICCRRGARGAGSQRSATQVAATASVAGEKPLATAVAADAGRAPGTACEGGAAAQGQGHGPGMEACSGRERCDGSMPPELSARVAAFLASEHAGALTTLNKVMSSLVDQLLHQQQPGASSGNVLALWQGVRQAFGALPGCHGTLQEMAALHAVAHHQATFHSYLVGLMAASALRLTYPDVAPRTVSATHATAPPCALSQRWERGNDDLADSAADAESSGSYAAHAVRALQAAGEVVASPERLWTELRGLVFEAGGEGDPGELLEGLLLSGRSEGRSPPAEESRMGVDSWAECSTCEVEGAWSAGTLLVPSPRAAGERSSVEGAEVESGERERLDGVRLVDPQSNDVGLGEGGPTLQGSERDRRGHTALLAAAPVLGILARVGWEATEAPMEAEGKDT